MMNEFYEENNIKLENLSRDYLQYPLQKIMKKTGGYKFEYPTFNDLYYLYITCKLSKALISKYFNIGTTTLGVILKSYNIKRDKSISNTLREKTMLNKYGVTHNSQLDSVKEQIKKTNLEKYGEKYFFQTNKFKSKCSETLEERYGVEHNSQLDSVKEQIKKTNLEKYGEESFSRSNYFRQTISPSSTTVDWNVLDNPSKLKDFIIQHNIKTVMELSKLTNISPSCLNKRITEYDLRNLFDYSQSNCEKEIREYVNQYFHTENNIRILDGKEIDIYIPEKKIGIEFNGDYWHNSNHRDKLYHQQKSLLAEDKGIFLYHIFEYEWNIKKTKILNQLNNLLGLNSSKIFARKCIIKEVNNKDKAIFLEQNHLQGNDICKISIGLYYNNELVSLMTFVKPRFNKNYEWELSRFCSKANCNVIGGASKLFKYFIKNYKPTSIISYSNISHTKGNLYKLLGFTLETISPPNYVWIKNDIIKTRYQSQKHKLIKEGLVGNSEKEIMENLGFNQIYDCGNKVWILKNPL